MDTVSFKVCLKLGRIIALNSSNNVVLTMLIVSPPQEHVTGSQWWTDYQPVSYTLTSKRGNRSQFQKSVSFPQTLSYPSTHTPIYYTQYDKRMPLSRRRCHSRYIKILPSLIMQAFSWSYIYTFHWRIDTLFNHMAGSDSGSGVAGSSFTHYNYPGIYQTQDFHHCGLESGDDIVNYQNRLEVQTCELVNLAEWVSILSFWKKNHWRILTGCSLATDTEYVRGRLAQYGNDLLSLGVDGFRLDAAKRTCPVSSLISLIINALYRYARWWHCEHLG